MENIKTRTRMEKEKEVLGIFEELYAERKQPITATFFKEERYERIQHLYGPNAVSGLLKSMCTRGMIQFVYPKEGRATGYWYAPNNIRIPHNKRDWETKEEKEEIRNEYVDSLPFLSNQDIEKFLIWTNSIYLKKRRKKGERMPIYSIIEEQKEDYEWLISFLQPYMKGLESRQRFVVSQRIGVWDKAPKSIEQIRPYLRLGYCQTAELFRDGLFEVEKLIIEQVKRERDV